MPYPYVRISPTHPPTFLSSSGLKLDRHTSMPGREIGRRKRWEEEKQ